ncbi:MAG: serine/threonine-protein phosphatase [Candidatus Muirbacterium halophilum]|nr:serine/threonine-protein phosphatase [Candidatus Muirbacterium halophilum]MCK9475127.1 serine/threonine-protein phosphatase [Candidatus Muirbacterium halophilum]
MNNTAHILNFSQLLYSLNIEEDIEKIDFKINNYFLDNFHFYSSAFYLFNDKEVMKYRFIGESITENELTECRIIVNGLFPEISKENIVADTIFIKRSKSLIFFPVISSKKCVGLFALFLKEKITEEQKETVSKIILDIGNILFEKIIENEDKNKYIEIANEYNREMETASLLHKKIIPKNHFDFENLNLKVIYRPYKLIGGDYYNCFEIEKSKKYLIVMADAAGKGMAGALISNMFHVILKYITITEKINSLEKICQNINAFMCESIDCYHFIASMFVLIDYEKKTFQVCNCGHSSPYYISKENIVEIDGGNPPMGIDNISSFEISERSIENGDKFLFWTDGFAESEEDGIALLRLLKDYSLLSIDNLIRVLYSKMNRENYTDDITLIVGHIFCQEEINA